MKKLFLTYFFFAAYLLAMVKPMLPILDYYINYDYIATQLCENRDKPILDCNGKCYVSKEIEKNKPVNNSDSTIPEFKIDYYLSNDFNFKVVKNEIILNNQKVIPITKISLKTGDILFSVFHPPKKNA